MATNLLTEYEEYIERHEIEHQNPNLITDSLNNETIYRGEKLEQTLKQTKNRKVANSSTINIEPLEYGRPL